MKRTYSADAQTWVPGAEKTEFPIQNLPFGIAQPKGRNESVVAAIGSFALDLSVLQEAGMISEEDFPIVDSFIELDQESLRELRHVVFGLLEATNGTLRDAKKVRDLALIPMEKANLQVPIPPTAFVDFYSGIHHASHVGQMFRPDQPSLLPNYRHLPIGYNGRASSVVASGTPIHRPKGQLKDGDAVIYAPTREMDFELEMGFYIGQGNEQGKRVTCTAAESHVLGLVLVNDWSARDVQRWEYQPLGPFLAKSFATTVSPWIVTLDALEPFRTAGMPQDPPVLPHLRTHGLAHFDLNLEVWIQSAKMKQPVLVSRTTTQNLYWSISQQIAHQTSNGTPMEFGDLYASGTISGEPREESGSMLELSWRGQHPIALGDETRSFLEDGDTVILKAWGEKDGVRIGFGECAGTIRPAKD